MKLRAIILLAAVAGSVGVAFLACESTDTTPPKGATILVSANPSTIPLVSVPECLALLTVSTCGVAEVVATVSNELGVPLPGQDVRFSSSAGLLFTGSVSNPTFAANLPIESDQFGNAVVNLITSTTANLTARSGAATPGMLTVQTVQGNLSQILLNLDTTTCPGTTSTVTSCGQEICFVAEAQDSDGDPVQGVVILFQLQNNTSGDNTFNGVFTPSQATTNSSGLAMTEFVPDSTCPSECAPSSSKTCTAEVIARTQGGLSSTPLQLSINIP